MIKNIFALIVSIIIWCGNTRYKVYRYDENHIVAEIRVIDNSKDLIGKIDKKIKCQDVLILNFNSCGGNIPEIMDISDYISDMPNKCIGFIDSICISGAVILALTCDEFYMTQNSKIGNIVPLKTGSYEDSVKKSFRYNVIKQITNYCEPKINNKVSPLIYWAMLGYRTIDSDILNGLLDSVSFDKPLVLSGEEALKYKLIRNIYPNFKIFMEKYITTQKPE